MVPVFSPSGLRLGAVLDGILLIIFQLTAAESAIIELENTISENKITMDENAKTIQDLEEEKMTLVKEKEELVSPSAPQYFTLLLQWLCYVRDMPRRRAL